MSTKATNPIVYGKPSIGCYLDHGNYNADELSAEIVNEAVALGFTLDAEAVTLLAMTEEEIAQNDDYSQLLHELSEEAIDWLNEQETRSFLYWANEGEANAFSLWPNVDGAKEDVGFTSRREVNEDTDPEDAERPCADYRGDWLHVNDHGNCTLYVRESVDDKAFETVDALRENIEDAQTLIDLYSGEDDAKTDLAEMLEAKAKTEAKLAQALRYVDRELWSVV